MQNENDFDVPIGLGNVLGDISFFSIVLDVDSLIIVFPSIVSYSTRSSKFGLLRVKISKNIDEETS